MKRNSVFSNDESKCGWRFLLLRQLSLCRHSLALFLCKDEASYKDTVRDPMFRNSCVVSSVWKICRRKTGMLKGRVSNPMSIAFFMNRQDHQFKSDWAPVCFVNLHLVPYCLHGVVKGISSQLKLPPKWMSCSVAAEQTLVTISPPSVALLTEFNVYEKNTPFGSFLVA